MIPSNKSNSQPSWSTIVSNNMAPTPNTSKLPKVTRIQKKPKKLVKLVHEDFQVSSSDEDDYEHTPWSDYSD